MSTPFFATINIGGELNKDILGSVIEILNDMCDEGNLCDEEYLKDEVIYANGSMSYSEFIDIGTTLSKLNITYLMSLDPQGTEEGITFYNFPNKKHIENIPPLYEESTLQSVTSDMNREPTVRINTILPYTNLLVDLLKKGNSCLPLHINNEKIKDTVKKMMADPMNAINILQNRINQIAPDIPTLPKLNIIG